MKSLLILLCTLLIVNLNNKTEPVNSAVYSWGKFKVKKQEASESRAILTGTTTHLSHFEVHATTLHTGNMPHSKHTHNDEEELILVREGQLKITTEKISKTIGPGSIAFIMPGEEHGLENVGDTPATYYIMKFKSKAPMDMARTQTAGGSMILNREDLKFNVHEKGGRWNYFDRPTASCIDFEMHATRLNEGISSHAPHTHPQEEIILMLKGNAKMNINGKDHKTSVGDVIFLDSEVPHGITNIGSEACEYFAFQWK